VSQEDLRAGIQRLNESLDPKNSGIDTRDGLNKSARNLMVAPAAGGQA